MPESERLPADVAKAQTVNNVRRYEEIYTECLASARRIAESREWGPEDDERVMKLADTLFKRFLDDQMTAQKNRVLSQYTGNLLELLEPFLNRLR